VELDRNHIISAGYVRNWASDDVVDCEPVPEGKRIRLAASRVGVRKKFYAGSPARDGSRSAGPAERARGVVENKALPLLRDLADRWPVTDSEERAWIALWLAMILCASPRRRQEIPGLVARFYAALEQDALLLAGLTVDQRPELAEADFELDSLFEEISAVASLLGQMHWTLLRFSRPALISCDHPLSTVLWTNDPTRSAGSASVLVLDSLELRIAVSPTAALLLSWNDSDDRVKAVPAAMDDCLTLNRSAWDKAERHRFWEPGVSPTGIDGADTASPISTMWFKNYDPRSSARLDAALDWIRRRLIDQQAGVNDRAVVTAWMVHAGGHPRVVFSRHAGEHASVFSAFEL
jgi:hypothetical protein